MPARSLFPGFAIGLAVLTLLGGCVNLEPQQDATRFYTLTPPAARPPVPAPEDAVRVGVRVTIGTGYLKQPAIAVRQTPQEIRFQENQRWAERVELGVERAVADGLARRHPSLFVDPFNRGSRGDTQLVVDIALVACEGTHAGEAVFGADWRLFAGNESRPVEVGHFHRTRSDWDGQDFGHLADLLSQLADELAGEIAEALAQAAQIE